MNRVFIAPRRYVQGRNVIHEAGAWIGPLGRKVAILWDSKVKEIIGEGLLPGLEKSGIEIIEIDFHGDSTKAEAKRVAGILEEKQCEVIIGAGGGKTLDTAKAAAASARTKVVTLPTIASNDSPTSSFTVWYDDDGNCQGFESWGVNPDLVLVDTQVIANAPVATFVAGMGDALGTWVEADTCFKARGPNLAGGTSTMAAMQIARLAYDILLEHGVEAKRAVEKNCVTPSVDKVIETNVLLSGLGFESCGVATAHMVANSLPSFPECHGLMHGHEVGFGVITQLCLDDEMPVAEKLRIVDFEISIGLPVTFAEIGFTDGIEGKLAKIGEICGGEGSLCENHPFPVTADDIVSAMIAADALGQERKKVLGVS